MNSLEDILKDVTKSPYMDIVATTPVVPTPQPPKTSQWTKKGLQNEFGKGLVYANMVTEPTFSEIYKRFNELMLVLLKTELDGKESHKTANIFKLAKVVSDMVCDLDVIEGGNLIEPERLIAIISGFFETIIDRNGDSEDVTAT